MVRVAGPLGERTDAPDEIFLIETKTRSWFVYPMNAGARASFGENAAGHHEFDAGSLLDRTGDR